VVSEEDQVTIGFIGLGIIGRPMVLNGNFKPGFRIELRIKDLQNTLDATHEAGVQARR
jgi:3-hydroxyisobutyrate dehydrogenase-like beta-hydroxyacid dehydrogenase